jgi:hypothetical protein
VRAADGVYDTHRHEAGMRDGFEQWAAREPKPGKLVKFRARLT